MNYSKESQDRIAKLQKIRAAGINPFPEKFDKQHAIKEILTTDAQTLRSPEQIAQKPSPTVKTAGRLVAYRSHGKLNFGQLQDATGRIQICIMADVLGADLVNQFDEYLDVADYIGLSGELFVTKHGELTIMVTEYTLLSKAIRPLPEKWHGLKDQETKYRQRYLDLVADRKTYERFQFRSEFLRLLREFYGNHGFTEIQTPVLVNKASGALAKPFSTHHNALDIDVYLRIAVETPQKEAIVGGFERVFEIGPVFRNEGIDPSHLQEFTMNEYYAAYWNFEDSMKFTESMLTFLLKELFGTLKVQIPDREGQLHEIDFTPPWPRNSIQDLIRRDAGIDLDKVKTADELREAIIAKNIDLSDVPNFSELGYGNLIDSLYKKVSRPKLMAPSFLINHPVELSPLARRNDDNPAITDRFQLLVSGWEVVNAYSELVDPIDQRRRLEEQASLKAGGDEDAMMMDEPYVRAMEHGMPPMSGWGMGIERMIALLTQQDNLRDVVLFPLLKPEDGQTIPTAKRAKAATSSAADSSASDLPDEKKKRFIAVLNDKVPVGKLMNALGHMTAGLAGQGVDTNEMCFLQYQDADENIHPNISHYGFIVTKAKNGNQIRKVREEAIARGIPYTDFTESMTVGTSAEQRAKTSATPEAELEYFGICLFGDTDVLAEFTKKFSLFN